MFRSFLYLLMLVVFVMVAVAANSHSEENQTPESKKSNVQMLMRDKLIHMQGVLDGLVTEDFAKVAENSKLLGMIGKAASWQSIETQEYQRLSDRYALLAKNLNKAAAEENLDSVLLQYLQLNISCVDCHRHMGEQP